MKFNITILALILSTPLVYATVEQSPTQPRNVAIADVLKANIVNGIQTSNCIYGAVAGEGDKVTIGLVTAFGAATINYPPPEPEQTWTVEADDHLLFKYKSSFYIRFNFDSKLKFTGASVHSIQPTPQGLDKIDCDFTSPLQ